MNEMNLHAGRMIAAFCRNVLVSTHKSEDVNFQHGGL